MIEWLRGLGYTFLPGPMVAPDGDAPERESFSDVLLIRRLREALRRLNPALPDEALDDAFLKVTLPGAASLLPGNHSFHQLLVEGVPVEYLGPDGRIVGDWARLLDPLDLDRNDFLVVNQFTITEGQYNRRPDIVIFVNGLPIVVVELKNLGDENATVRGAFNQLRTYQAQIPSLFYWNELLVVSDGADARMGTLTSDFDRFLPWKTIDGVSEVAGFNQLEVLTKGVFHKGRLLDLVRNFITFDIDGANLGKKVAAYHQYHAVNKAVEATVDASLPNGDRRVGVVWHTQGSGKSLSMVFYAGKLIRDPRMGNPTLVVLTDRNDLDEQLLGAFAAAQDLIPSPKQAESREDLKNLLRVASGGLIFTTIQKFVPPKGERYPLLSERRNVVVIADEAHRSQYDFIDGFARHLRDGLPNASFIGFTGTPIETGDKITRNVFGDYIDVYDIAQAVEDGATVPIYYEGRLAEISLDPAERPNIDVEFEDVTEAEEDRIKKGLRSKWARIEALVGTDRRLNSIASDIVKHFGDRLAAMDGKAMIVCMSRRICADLYSEIIRLQPEWHSGFDSEGQLKVVMTGNSSDAPQLQPHIRNKQRNELIKRRLRDPADPLRLVIVRDMWLTGFDAPCLHTMYVDKPMKGHTLMQAIARVNRVFQGKPGGLVVDYLGLGEALKRAFRDYTDNHGRGEVAIDLDVAVAALQEKVEVVRGILHGFDYSQAFAKNPQAQYQAMAGGLDFILGREDGKNRFIGAVNGLSKAFRLSGATPEALRLRDEVAYFEGLRAGLIKWTPPGKLDVDELDLAVGQIVSRAVMSEGVVDLFAQAGIDRPDISLVSDQFLQEVKEMPQRNLAAAALERLLRDEIKVRSRRNIIEARRFSEMLDVTMRKYHNRSIEAAQIIVELVAMAKDFRDLAKRGVDLNLTDDELAFYDALSANQSAIDTIGAETLQGMARELASSLQNSVTVDWALKESVRAALRLKVKRLLRKYRYPPDQQDAATELVLEQAEVLCETWVPSPL